MHPLSGRQQDMINILLFRTKTTVGRIGNTGAAALCIYQEDGREPGHRTVKTSNTRIKPEI